MAMPEQYQKDIQLFNCWDDKILPEYRPERHYKATIAFDLPDSHLCATQAYGDSPEEARQNLIDQFAPTYDIPAGTNTKRLEGAGRLPDGY